jgi:hypothetical protein
MKGSDHQRHADKKKPTRTLKEKRAEKHAKKLAKGLEASGMLKMPTDTGTH